MTGPILLAFGIWMLFSSDYSWLNAVIGLAGSFVAALCSQYRFSAWQLVRLIAAALIRLPQAVWESFMIVVFPHRFEKISYQDVDHPRNPWLIFCQTLLVTFTPRSLVINIISDDKIKLHSLERRESE